MDTLKHYLNSIPKPQQEDFAIRAGTTIGYLRKACTTKPKLDGALCRKLEALSGGAVKKSDLRPDIWPDEAAA